MSNFNVFKLLVVKDDLFVSFNVPQDALTRFLDFINLNDVEVRIVGCDVVTPDDLNFKCSDFGPRNTVGHVESKD